jgi:hypothetical protein
MEIKKNKIKYVSYEYVGTMADNKFRPACHWLDIKM